VKKALLIIAHEGYQHTEYSVTKSQLEQSGIAVEIASNLSGSAIAHDGSTTHTHLLLTDIIVGQYDAIIFIGGPGAMQHLDSEISYDIAIQATQDNIPLAAICVAPRILTKARVLNGRQATGWDGDGQLSDLFLLYVADDVVVDGNIVTANGPHAAAEFGRKIVSLINQ
jgi:protease I